MPRKISPELPVLVAQAQEGSQWLFELKLDGYRIIAFVRRGKASLCTRRGNDWTARFPTIAAAFGNGSSAAMQSSTARSSCSGPTGHQTSRPFRT